MEGLLFVNLGSPDSPQTKDVRKYLDEFLMDKYVIDVPYWLRVFIVRGIILNTRSKKSAYAYKSIWWKDGSPLVVLTERLLDKIKTKTDLPVEMAMRYGKYTIKEALQRLYDKGVRTVRMTPLYPHYAMATVKTVVELANNLQKEYFQDLQIKTIPPFYGEKDYITALSKSISEVIGDNNLDMVLFSYHGVPKRHIRKEDITKKHCKIDDDCCKDTTSPAFQFCYRAQCFKTTELVVKELNIDKNKVINTFQSRLGVDPWLQPYTDQTIAALPSKGIKKIAMVMPAFVSDCLETIEEIGVEAKRIFLENGGQEFIVVPCLNDRDDWATFILDWTINS